MPEKKRKGARDLKVFELAFELSLDIHGESLKWPQFEQYGGLADQTRYGEQARVYVPICLKGTINTVVARKQSSL